MGEHPCGGGGDNVADSDGPAAMRSTRAAIRPHASASEVAALAARVSAPHAVLILTAAYTGMRWGELAGLQWD